MRILRPRILLDCGQPSLPRSNRVQRSSKRGSSCKGHAKELPPYASDSCSSFTRRRASAWDRYGYRVRGEWMGVVHALLGKRESPVDPPPSLHPGPPSWISRVVWDCGIKWRIGEKHIVREISALLPSTPSRTACASSPAAAGIPSSTPGWKATTSSGAARMSFKISGATSAQTRRSTSVGLS